MDIKIENKPLTEADIAEKEALLAYEKERDDAIKKAETDKAALLAKLGITADEAKLLLS
jgi:hypothetical protein